MCGPGTRWTPALSRWRHQTQNVRLSDNPTAQARSVAIRARRGQSRGLFQSIRKGEPGTKTFQILAAGNTGADAQSYWHDVPLRAGDAAPGAPATFNMVVEIPKYTRAKMEIDTKAAMNPIVQDTKNGELRDYHGPIYWNYGAIPQTWEDPNVAGGDDVMGCFGDNDPLDIVEVGQSPREMGSVVPVKVLGVIALIDGGELDWKVLALATDDPLASSINSLQDLDSAYPFTTAGVREWFRWYKTPDGKPLNQFGYQDSYLSANEAVEVIEETHEAWQELRSGKRDAGKLWVGVD